MIPMKKELKPSFLIFWSFFFFTRGNGSPGFNKVGVDSWGWVEIVFISGDSAEAWTDNLFRLCKPQKQQSWDHFDTAKLWKARQADICLSVSHPLKQIFEFLLSGWVFFPPWMYEMLKMTLFKLLSFFPKQLSKGQLDSVYLRHLGVWYGHERHTCLQYVSLGLILGEGESSFLGWEHYW